MWTDGVRLDFQRRFLPCASFRVDACTDYLMFIFYTPYQREEVSLFLAERGVFDFEHLSDTSLCVCTVSKTHASSQPKRLKCK